MKPPADTTLPERFWSKVNEDGPIPEHAPELGNCWVWTGTVNSKKPYGRFAVGSRTDGTRKRPLVHRLSFQDATGTNPEGLDVDHWCHNERCVRPDHLRALTRSENASNRKGANTNSKSGVRGVNWHRRIGKWAAAGRVDGKSKHLGYFDDLSDAEAAVIAHRREHMPMSYMDREREPALAS